MYPPPHTLGHLRVHFAVKEAVTEKGRGQGLHISACPGVFWGREGPPPPALHVDALEAAGPPGMMGSLLRQPSGILVLDQRGQEAASSTPCRICGPPGAEKGPAQLWTVIQPLLPRSSFRPLSWSTRGGGAPEMGRGTERGEEA